VWNFFIKVGMVKNFIWGRGLDKKCAKVNWAILRLPVTKRSLRLIDPKCLIKSLVIMSL
jgi:hypothetical protein